MNDDLIVQIFETFTSEYVTLVRIEARIGIHIGGCEVLHSTQFTVDKIRAPQAMFLAPFAYFRGFYVVDYQQSKGVGTALFLKAVEEARKINSYGMWWESHYTLPDKLDEALLDPAIKIYNRHAVAVQQTNIWYVEF